MTFEEVMNTLQENYTLKKSMRVLGYNALQAKSKKFLECEISADTKCTVYTCGYASYKSGARKTVFWLADCFRPFIYLSNVINSDCGGISVIDLDTIRALDWQIVVTLNGEERIFRNYKLPFKNDDDEVDNQHTPEIFTAVENIREKINSLMNLLPEALAEMYILYHAYGFTQKKISEFLGVSRQCVTKKLQRAQKIFNERKYLLYGYGI